MNKLCVHKNVSELLFSPKRYKRSDSERTIGREEKYGERENTTSRDSTTSKSLGDKQT